MKRDLLLGDQTLFRVRDVFEVDYLPELLNYREAQLEELAVAVQPAVYGARPFNTVLRGLREGLRPDPWDSLTLPRLSASSLFSCAGVQQGMEPGRPLIKEFAAGAGAIREPWPALKDRLERAGLKLNCAG